VKDGVGVLLGVKVTVGVEEFVAVCVMGVLVGDGVNVRDGVGVCEGTSVAVKVWVGGVGGVGVLPLKVVAAVTSMETLKRMVRELLASILFTAKGTSLGTMGVYSSSITTVIRLLLFVPGEKLLSHAPEVQYSTGVVPGPVS